MNDFLRGKTLVLSVVKRHASNTYEAVLKDEEGHVLANHEGIRSQEAAVDAAQALEQGYIAGMVRKGRK